MAQVAGDRYVRAGQREARRAVIERSAKPRSRGVARCARCRITGSNVVRNGAAKSCRALIILGVAAIAIRRKRPAVVAVHVAQSAGDCSVRAGQRERRGAVIEC
jgi:hypothetical protein